MNEPPIHPFENYPRRALSGGVTRRQFLGSLLTEFHLAAHQEEGNPSAKVKDLGCLEDDDLKRFFPCIVPDTEITIKDQAVWGKPPGSTRPTRLFPLEPAETFVFNLFNGENSLEHIGYQMAVNLGWPSQRAFAFTRGMFLTLVDLRVAVPKNPPLE